MRQFILLSLIFLLVSAIFACSTKSPLPGKPSVPEAQSGESRPVKASWEAEWDKTLAEAKKEGRVTIYSIWRPENRIALTKAFADKFGISVEFTAFGRGAELLAKVKAEQRAGLYAADIFGAGGPTLIVTMKPEGVVGPVEPLLILPDIKDPRAWSGGKFPFTDKDKTSIAMIASVRRFILYNTNMVKKGEITTYKDVLKPQYKGKISLNDPTVTGSGNAFMSHLALDILNPEEAAEFLRQLIKQQQVMIFRDARSQVESIALGKFAIGLGPDSDVEANFLDAGAPIDVVYLKEGSYVTPASGAFGVPAKFAHPNAAKIFVNWLLTREGQTVFSRSFGIPSMRIDVPTEGYNAIFLAQPGEKLYLQSEEFILFQSKMLDLAKQAIEEAKK